MFATAIRRAAQASQPSLAQTAPVSRLKKVWPPDFSKLSPGEQLKFEKRYKRRVRLAAARPLWNKVIKLTQLFSITFVSVYCVLFMDWKVEGQNQPFSGVRKQFWALFQPLDRRSSLRDASQKPDPSA